VNIASTCHLKRRLRKQLRALRQYGDAGSQAQPSALKVALGSAAAAAPKAGPTSQEQPCPPAPRLEPKARRPPRPESHPVPLTVPARLKAAVLTDYLEHWTLRPRKRQLARRVGQRRNFLL
jgi:hypothetical protein